MRAIFPLSQSLGWAASWDGGLASGVSGTFNRVESAHHLCISFWSFVFGTPRFSELQCGPVVSCAGWVRADSSFLVLSILIKVHPVGEDCDVCLEISVALLYVSFRLREKIRFPFLALVVSVFSPESTSGRYKSRRSV